MVCSPYQRKTKNHETHETTRKKPDHGFFATTTIETPNGKLKFFSQNLSAENNFPNTPLRAEIFTLFSDSGLIPVRRISVRPPRIGAKNVQFAYVARSIL